MDTFINTSSYLFCVAIIERPIFHEALSKLSKGLVLTIVGPRRGGKSSLLKWLTKKTNGTYLNFEDERLPKTISFILEKGEQEKSLLALDEVHLVPGWEKAVNTLRDKVPIVVSGSTSHLLSREYGTFLTGRRRELLLLPLSYNEFKDFGGKDYEEYLSFGGFPEVVLKKDLELLSYYFQDVIIRDVAIRHNIRNIEKLKDIAKYLISHSSKTFTLRSIAKTFSLSPTTVEEYISFLSEAFLLSTLKAYHRKHSARNKLPFKIHAIDHGYVSLFKQVHWKGRALETAVYWEIKRLWKGDIFYGYGEKEWDIIVGDPPRLNIQVSYEIKKNEDRECRGVVIALYGECKEVPTYRPWEIDKLLKDYEFI